MSVLRRVDPFWITCTILVLTASARADEPPDSIIPVADARFWWIALAVGVGLLAGGVWLVRRWYRRPPTD